MCLVVTSLLGKYVPASIITQATELEKCPLLLRIPYLAVAMLGVRTRYYVAWMIAEGAARATGMAYKSPEMTSVSVLGIETSINIRNATQVSFQLYSIIYIYIYIVLESCRTYLAEILCIW